MYTANSKLTLLFLNCILFCDSYWTAGAEVDEAMQEVAQQVVEAVSQLDDAMLATDALYTEYRLRSPLQCEQANAALEQFVPLDVPLPLLDGNFP